MPGSVSVIRSGCSLCGWGDQRSSVHRPEQEEGCGLTWESYWHSVKSQYTGNRVRAGTCCGSGSSWTSEQGFAGKVRGTCPQQMYRSVQEPAVHGGQCGCVWNPVCRAGEDAGGDALWSCGNDLGELGSLGERHMGARGASTLGPADATRGEENGRGGGSSLLFSQWQHHREEA